MLALWVGLAALLAADPTGTGLDPGVLGGFGIAAPVVTTLIVLLWRSEKRNDAKDEELRRSNERLIGFQERNAVVLAQAVEIMEHLATLFEELEPSPAPRPRPRWGPPS